MYSTEVKPVPSSREEKRRVPMVLVKVEGVAILRPPSSKGYRKKEKLIFYSTEPHLSTAKVSTGLQGVFRFLQSTP